MKYIIGFIALLFIVILIDGVVMHPKLHHVKPTTQKVIVYKEHHLNDNGTTDFLWWYIIAINNNSYYYYSSTTPVSESTYPIVPWVASPTVPSIIKSANVEQEEIESVPTEELGNTVNTTINEEDSAQIDSMINEGNPNTGESSAGSESSSSGSESSSSGSE